ncbi:Neuropeptide Y receptor type 1 [Trichinella pseudospiralis]|uniref:Neuropeptide Y receptor type 1 n=1 Tax=Trichinella pseudospiralis TaxID=6337 RepID=A0A0V1FN45_TRIPS|nr:Neuropeptide Y receptor type 1 [Trichinella pseudospiralis]
MTRAEVGSTTPPSPPLVVNADSRQLLLFLLLLLLLLVNGKQSMAISIISTTTTTTTTTTTSNPALSQNACVEYSDYVYEIHKDLTREGWIRGIFLICYLVIFIAGITGNVCVIISVARKTSLQSVRNLFIVSLSCSDIVVCLTSLPITPITIIRKNWLFGLPLCYIFPLLQCMSTIISTFTLMAIAIDRFILIIYPTKPPLNRCHATTMIVAIWTLAISISIPMLLHYNLYKIPYHQDGNVTVWYCGYFCDETWPNLEARQAYGSVVLVLQFIIPLIVITFCYASISLRVGKGVALRQGGKMLLANGAGAPDALLTRHKVALKRRQRTNRMLISMVAVFVACWFFQVLLNVLRDFNATPFAIASQPYLSSLIVHCIAMSSTLWNPILYAWLNDTFRTAFYEILPFMSVLCCISKPNAAAMEGRFRSDSIID